MSRLTIDVKCNYTSKDDVFFALQEARTFSKVMHINVLFLWKHVTIALHGNETDNELMNMFKDNYMESGL